MKKFRPLFSLILSILLSQAIALNTAVAQVKPSIYSSADIQTKIGALQNRIRILYVAAHPDDENTRLIAWLAREKKAEVYYLSLTRGDGGQNLIGTELGEGLGVIRSEELMAARRTDAGKQLFTSARDFGFSKHPDETFTIWPREQILAEVVKTIRVIQPQIIINRFSVQPGGTHGHHTASAILATEAFKLAADTNAFRNQFKENRVGTWQAKRIYWNISSFFFMGREKEFNPSRYLKLDIGDYNPLYGKNYAEIAAESRSEHKSQGFGSAGARGPVIEYFQFVAGDSAKENLFEGIESNWGSLQGNIPSSGKRKIEKNTAPSLADIDKLIASINQNYNSTAPYNSVAQLIELLKLFKKTAKIWTGTKEAPSIVRKIKEIEELVIACLGIRTEARAKQATYCNADTLSLAYEIVSRNPLYSPKLTRLEGFDFLLDSLSVELKNNELYKGNAKITLPSYYNSAPYWLQKQGSLGAFTQAESKEGKALMPVNEALALKATFVVNGLEIEIPVPIYYQKVDPVKGEIYQPLEVVPALTIKPSSDFVFSINGKPTKLSFSLMAEKDIPQGELLLQIVGNNALALKQQKFQVIALKAKQKISLETEVSLAEGEPTYVFAKYTDANLKTYTQDIQRIRYDHIPNQVMLPLANIKVIALKTTLTKQSKEIGYIMGAGDQVPNALRLVGIEMPMLERKEIEQGNLFKKYKTIMVGIRAYNTFDWLKAAKPQLMKFMEEGGTLIVQYNTANFLSGLNALDSIGPKPFKISNDRVTVETAPIKILDDKHPIFNSPNQITQADFDNWVQERGLYFARTWDKAFVPLLEMADPNEKPTQGGLLVAKVGKGHFVYTGLSFFRQLPAGVPGAFRLMINLLNLGSESKATSAKTTTISKEKKK